MPKSAAEKLRKSSETLQRRIDQLRAPRLTNTARRQRMNESALSEARSLERLQSALLELADGLEDLTVPEVLSAITMKSQVEDLLNFEDYPTSQWTEDSRKRLKRAGITVGSYEDARAALLKLIDPAMGYETPEEEIARLVREVALNGFIVGYFPTPEPVIDLLLEAAGIDPNQPVRILEPSAGAGHIADAILHRFPHAQVDTIEIAPSLRVILDRKGHRIIGNDLFEVEPEDTWQYDFVIMNPPFEHAADCKHVQRAYQFLKPGGRLVAVMSASVMYNSTSTYEAFRDWLGELDGSIDDLPDGAFKSSDRPTGVKTELVVIDKPTEAAAPAPTYCEQFGVDPEGGPVTLFTEVGMDEFVTSKFGEITIGAEYFEVHCRNWLEHPDHPQRRILRVTQESPADDLDWLDCPVCGETFGLCTHTDEEKRAALAGDPVQTSERDPLEDLDLTRCARCGVSMDVEALIFAPDRNGVFCEECLAAVEQGEPTVYEVARDAVKRATETALAYRCTRCGEVHDEVFEGEDGLSYCIACWSLLFDPKPEQVSLLPSQPAEPPDRRFIPVAVFADQVAGQPMPSPRFIDSIADFGQLVPVAVRETEQGYILADGRRRVLALLAIAERTGAGADNLPVLADVYRAEDWSHDDVISLIANQHRSPNIVSEMESIEALVSQGYTVKQICEATGLKSQVVDKRLRLAGLVPELRAALKADLMAPGVAEQAAKLPVTKQLRLVEVLERNEKITGQDVAAVRRVMVEQEVQTLFSAEDFATPGADDVETGGEQSVAPVALQDDVQRLIEDRSVLIDAIRAVLRDTPNTPARKHLSDALSRVGVEV